MVDVCRQVSQPNGKCASYGAYHIPKLGVSLDEVFHLVLSQRQAVLLVIRLQNRNRVLASSKYVHHLQRAWFTLAKHHTQIGIFAAQRLGHAIKQHIPERAVVVKSRLILSLSLELNNDNATPLNASNLVAIATHLGDTRRLGAPRALVPGRNKAFLRVTGGYRQRRNIGCGVGRQRKKLLELLLGRGRVALDAREVNPGSPDGGHLAVTAKLVEPVGQLLRLPGREAGLACQR